MSILSMNDDDKLADDKLETPVIENTKSNKDDEKEYITATDSNASQIPRAR